MLGWDARDLGDNGFHLGHINELRAILRQLQPLIGACLINHINRLVRHVPVIDIAARQLRRHLERLVGVANAMMLLKTALQALEDLDGVADRRLNHVNLLEATCQGAIFLENTAKLLEGRGADATDLAGRQQRLEQVGGVHHPAGGCTRANDGVNFVNKQDGLRALFQRLEQRLEALLEVAAVLGTGQQRAQIERVHHRL